MELRINLGYEQILQLVRQLPFQEKLRLSREIEQELRSDAVRQTEEPEFTNLQKLLLTGPVMSDTQFEQFYALRRGR